MPPKRRVRNGNFPTPAHILKPLISSSLPSAAAVASAASVTATALANSGNVADYSYAIANGSTTTSSSSSSLNASPLTVKQKQQLERNAFLSSLTKDQLKVECRKRGQRIAGNKTDLVN